MARRQSPAAPSAPLVSCILPVFNGERFLAQALGSIVDQGGAALDIIVIDDGSTDRSAEVASGFPGVRVHRQANAGVAEARNAGLELARGQFIAFLDADDLWLPGKLDRQLRLLEARPEVDLCFGMVRHVLKTDGAGQDPAVAPDEAPRVGRLAQCMLARRRAVERVGPFDGGTLTRADQDWFLRARELGLVEAILPDVLVHRRIHGANHSIVHDDAVVGDFLAIARRALERRRRQGLPLGAVERWTPGAPGPEAR